VCVCLCVCACVCVCMRERDRKTLSLCVSLSLSLSHTHTQQLLRRSLHVVEDARGEALNLAVTCGARAGAVPAQIQDAALGGAAAGALQLPVGSVAEHAAPPGDRPRVNASREREQEGACVEVGGGRRRRLGGGEEEEEEEKRAHTHAHTQKHTHTPVSACPPTSLRSLLPPPSTPPSHPRT
jgi:hypothetical protein